MRTSVVALLALVLPPPLVAQTPIATAGAVAARYSETYNEIENLRPLSDQVATVHHLVLSRDAGELTLEDGKLYLLSSVGGRTVGAVFRGVGRFRLAPSLPTEQAELRHFAGTPALDDTITAAVLLFADSTLAQLHALTFGPGELPGAVGSHVGGLVASLQGRKAGSFASDVIGPMLNGEESGFFLAQLERAHGDPVMFEINPADIDAVQLFRPVERIRWGRSWAVVTQFPRQGQAVDTSGSWEYRNRLTVANYRTSVTLTKTFTADLDFAAVTTVALRAEEPLGPWLLLDLQWKTVVDSARWGDGTPAVTYKANESDDLWVKAPRRLAAGDTLSLTLIYHAGHPDLIDRYGDWFFLDPGAAWYPRNGQGRDFATFDATFHSPVEYPLASVGEKIDSSIAGRVATTHWITRRPTDYATFNLGIFGNYHVQHADEPTLDVMLSEDAHREMAHGAALAGGYISQQSHMKENVTADVSNSLKWFTLLFGAPPFQHFYVTEIPYGEGVSFPGLIDLSWATFQNTSLDGFDEFFRAHEVAHQWWGNGVGQGSYRDKWLTEGLASFSGLWYLQAERKRNTEYFRFLDEYRADIQGDKDVAGPIWIGTRNASPDVGSAYQVITYEKGAWVFQMLRMLMLNLSTGKDDRFTDMMQNYYQSFNGRAATTADFQGVVERHIGMPMDWFFDEWVKGTGIPTYHVAWKGEAAGTGQFIVRLRVTQEHVPADFHMPVLVSVDLGDNRFAHYRVDVNGGTTEYVSHLLPAMPKGVVFNDLHAVLADVKTGSW